MVCSCAHVYVLTHIYTHVQHICTPSNTGKVSGTINGLFRAVVIGTSVQQLRKEVTGPEMTTADVEAIWKLAKQPNWLEHLSSSLAPSIYGILCSV